jgi:hypothetical protein
MQPESPLFEKHNTDKIATEALNEAEEQELSMKTRQVLEHPDAIEQSKIGHFASEKNFLDYLDLSLSMNTGKTGETIKSRGVSMDLKAEAKLFQPHDKAASEQYPGVEFTTSVIGFDLEHRYKNPHLEHTYKNPHDKKTGQLLLFKLDDVDTKMTAKDLEFGTNCRFGAFIREGKVQPFAIEMIEDEVDGERERMQLNYLDPEQDGEEHTAVRDEIRTFLQQRQQDV